jgi:hypothetical protein
MRGRLRSVNMLRRSLLIPAVAVVLAFSAASAALAGGKPVPKNTPAATAAISFNVRAQLAATRIVNADESSASAVLGRPRAATAAKPLAKEYDSSLVGTAITASGLQVTVAGHPSASLTRAIASQADGIPISIRAVPHSEAQLEHVQAEITADLKYWTARHVHITTWGPDLSSDKVSVTLSHYSARSAKLITARYGTAWVSVSTASVTAQPAFSRTDDDPPWFGGDEVEHTTSLGTEICTSGFSLAIGSTYLVPTDTHCFGSDFSHSFYNPGGVIGTWYNYNTGHDTLLIHASSAGDYIWSDPTSANRRVVGVASTDPIGGLICTDGYTTREICSVQIVSTNQNITYTINGTSTTVTNTVKACQTGGKTAFAGGDSGGPAETTIGSSETTARGAILAVVVNSPWCGFYMPERYIESDFGATTVLG